ncbi:MAG: hypothetical protein QOD75_633 [Blastocatellia bacterium]|jgi:Na+-driven multidrug efflux pump|nr:hypothetical protein [Blastocatellia bacterium]
MKKVTVWGFLIAGVLGTFTGLRDIFAPGFLNASPRIPSQTDITLQFVAAAVFLALAAFASRGGFDRGLGKS